MERWRVIAKCVGIEDDAVVEDPDDEEVDGIVDEFEEMGSYRIVVGVSPEPRGSAPSLGFRLRNGGRVAIPRTVVNGVFIIAPISS